MAEFRPVSPPLYVFDAGGGAHTVFGWWSQTPGWLTIQPVVANPDGPGIGPWHYYHGDDPWNTGG